MACNCHDYPFVPHVPCFEECTRRSLSMASFDDLLNVFDIPVDIAKKINAKNIESEVLQMSDFGLSDEEMGTVRQLFSSLNENQAALDWLKQQFPLFDEQFALVDY